MMPSDPSITPYGVQVFQSCLRWFSTVLESRHNICPRRQSWRAVRRFVRLLSPVTLARLRRQRNVNSRIVSADADDDIKRILSLSLYMYPDLYLIDRENRPD